MMMMMMMLLKFLPLLLVVSITNLPAQAFLSRSPATIRRNHHHADSDPHHQFRQDRFIIRNLAANNDAHDSEYDDDDDFDDDWADHEEHWLDEAAEQDESISFGQAIARGQLVLTLPGMATSEDCQALFTAALEARQRQQQSAASYSSSQRRTGRSRFSVADPKAFDPDIVLRCDELLLRVLDVLDEAYPTIYETLFECRYDDDGSEEDSTDDSMPKLNGVQSWLQAQPLNAQLEEPTVPPLPHLQDTCESLRDLYMQSELEWSEGEPAINIYETDGYFGAHKDHLALTVLIPLTEPTQDFRGGGTGFWRGNRQVDENPATPPDVIIRPSAGGALIFGGDVTHAGLPVEQGLRSVFVCSFSTKTPASQPDRLHGLQAPPKVSANFKGTL